MEPDSRFFERSVTFPLFKRSVTFPLFKRSVTFSLFERVTLFCTFRYITSFDLSLDEIVDFSNEIPAKVFWALIHPSVEPLPLKNGSKCCE
jgi:hypothetical protein